MKSNSHKIVNICGIALGLTAIAIANGTILINAFHSTISGLDMLGMMAAGWGAYLAITLLGALIIFSPGDTILFKILAFLTLALVIVPGIFILPSMLTQSAFSAQLGAIGNGPVFKVAAANIAVIIVLTVSYALIRFLICIFFPDSLTNSKTGRILASIFGIAVGTTLGLLTLSGIMGLKGDLSALFTKNIGQGIIASIAGIVVIAIVTALILFFTVKPEAQQPEAQQPEARQPEARRTEARRTAARRTEARRTAARQPEARQHN